MEAFRRKSRTMSVFTDFFFNPLSFDEISVCCENVVILKTILNLNVWLKRIHRRFVTEPMVLIPTQNWPLIARRLRKNQNEKRLSCYVVVQFKYKKPTKESIQEMSEIGEEIQKLRFTAIVNLFQNIKKICHF